MTEAPSKPQKVHFALRLGVGAVQKVRFALLFAVEAVRRARGTPEPGNERPQNGARPDRRPASVDEVGAGLNRPPSQTGLADLPHPAFPLAIGLLQDLHLQTQNSRLLTSAVSITEGVVLWVLRFLEGALTSP